MRAARGFASDNASGVHPEVLQAIAAANVGHVKAYGDDPWTARAVEIFRGHFGPQAEVFLVFTGSGANVLALSAMTRPYHSVLCSEWAHIQVDECGAPERFAGCKLLPVPAPDGKLTPAALAPFVERVGDQHHSQARVVSVTQSTEFGTVYTPQELRALADFAHERGLLLHLDGARLANAAAALGVSLRQLTADCGVDALSFGGTKNGLLAGEAVVFLDPQLAKDFLYLRKQSTQLASKMRFIAAQFEALLGTDLWLRNARHANAMAALLAEQLRDLPGLHFTQRVQVNSLFAVLPPEAIVRLQERFAFYLWNEATHEVRWMTSWDTSEPDVLEFARTIREELKR